LIGLIIAVRPFLDFLAAHRLILLGYKEFTLYKWLRTQTFDLFALSFRASSPAISPPAEDAWKERKEAEDTLKRYLDDFPGMWAYFFLGCVVCVDHKNMNRYCRFFSWPTGQWEIENAAICSERITTVRDHAIT
jgi:hypothetical protein